MWMAPPEDIARISKFERNVEPGIRARYPNQPSGAGTFRLLAAAGAAFSRSFSRGQRSSAPVTVPLTIDKAPAA